MKSVKFGAALALAALLGAGCGGNSSSNSGSSGVLFSGYVQGNFPGTAVNGSFTAPDGAAASPAGFDVGGNWVTVWTDTSSRAAIATFTTAGYLWASYTSGNGAWSPFVAIAGERTQGNDPTIDSARAVFLNTAAHANADARARSGDAIIIFQQLQPADPANADADATSRLWSAYFDLSQAGAPTATLHDDVSNSDLDLEWGFQTGALPIDDDPDDSLAGNASIHTEAWGLISDSFCGSYTGSDGNRHSGDATNFVWALYMQDTDAGGATGDRYHTKQFDLTSAGDYSFTDNTATMLNVHSDVNTGNNAQDTWIAHNGSVFIDWTDTGGTDNNDPLWTHYAFDASGVSNAIAFFNTDSVQNLGDPAGLSAANLYGTDDGLAFTLLVYLENGFGDGGNKNIDADVYVATFDPTGGNSGGALLGTPAEADLFVTKPTIPNAADTTSLQTRIARDGSWIAIAYLQNDDNDGGDANDNVGVWATAYDTSRDLLGTTPLADAVQLTANMGVASEDDVSGFEFQEELADGTSYDVRRSVQSDTSVMNILFNQASSSTATDLELHAVGCKVTLVGGTKPVIAVNSSGGAGGADTVIATVHTGWTNTTPTLARAAAYDRGTGGEANVVFFCQANEATNAPSASNFEEMRLFHYSGSTVNLSSDEISSHGTQDTQQLLDGTLMVVTSPRSMSTGAFAGSYAHIVVSEEDVATDAQLFHVAWDKTLATPALGTYEEVSLGNFGTPALAPFAIGVAGDGIGAYWYQNAHLYFNGWLPTTGWVGPALIDDAYPDKGVISATFYLDGDGTSSSLDELPSSTVFFDKVPDPGYGDRRLLYRTHN